MPVSSPPDTLTALAAFGLDLASLASRAVGAGGGAPVFSGAVAPEASEGEEEEDFSPDARAAWEERTALLEFDGGWPRPVAEAIATRLQALERAGVGPEAWAALDTELTRMEEPRSRARVAPRAGDPTGRTLSRRATP